MFPPLTAFVRFYGPAATLGASLASCHLVHSFQLSAWGHPLCTLSPRPLWPLHVCERAVLCVGAPCLLMHVPEGKFSLGQLCEPSRGSFTGAAMTQSNGTLTTWRGLGLREECTGGCVVTKQ